MESMEHRCSMEANDHTGVAHKLAIAKVQQRSQGSHEAARKLMITQVQHIS